MPYSGPLLWRSASPRAASNLLTSSVRPVSELQVARLAYARMTPDAFPDGLKDAADIIEHWELFDNLEPLASMLERAATAHVGDAQRDAFKSCIRSILLPPAEIRPLAQRRAPLLNSPPEAMLTCGTHGTLSKDGSRACRGAAVLPPSWARRARLLSARTSPIVAPLRSKVGMRTAAPPLRLGLPGFAGSATK